MPDEPILWKDRKRILGLPISFTRYELTATRLTIRKGLFSTTTDETRLYRVLDTSLTRTLGQKILGVGTIKLYSADRSHEEHFLVNIRNSENVRRLLNRLVEDERLRLGVTAKEMYAAGGFTGGFNPADLDGDGIPDYLQN